MRRMHKYRRKPTASGINIRIATRWNDVSVGAIPKPARRATIAQQFVVHLFRQFGTHFFPFFLAFLALAIPPCRPLSAAV